MCPAPLQQTRMTGDKGDTAMIMPPLALRFIFVLHLFGHRQRSSRLRPKALRPEVLRQQYIEYDLSSRIVIRFVILELARLSSCSNTEKQRPTHR